MSHSQQHPLRLQQLQVAYDQAHQLRIAHSRAVWRRQYAFFEDYLNACAELRRALFDEGLLPSAAAAAQLEVEFQVEGPFSHAAHLADLAIEVAIDNCNAAEAEVRRLDSAATEAEVAAAAAWLGFA